MFTCACAQLLSPWLQDKQDGGSLGHQRLGTVVFSEILSEYTFIK